MDILIKRYTPELGPAWSEVLRNSRNGIFLFERKYVEYHKDRFTDFSMIIFLDGKPVALFPASIDIAAAHVSSHAGLTFGGVVLERELRGEIAIALIEAILGYIQNSSIKKITIKLLPQLFCSYPSAELDYALWQKKFVLTRRDLSSVLPLSNSIKFNTSKLQAIRKAKKAEISVFGGHLKAFHSVLEQVLQAYHGVPPVHSLAELEFLMMSFPENIFIRCAIHRNDVLAGTIIFNYGHVWHTQYLASSKEGRSIGALDLVVNAVVEEAKARNVAFLSFGTSTESAGTVLNEGLLWQKESFGARSVVHDFMEKVF